MLELLVACFVIMLASLSGKLFVWRGAGEFIERNLHLMVTFAAGVFLIFALQLSREVFEHVELLAGLGWVAAGAIVITLACRLFPHKHTSDDTEHKGHAHLDAHRMLFSDSIHNAADGILLAATFSISPVIGFAAAVSVFLHEVVQEIAEFFVLRDSGYTVRGALAVNFATSATILIGAVGGFVLLEVFEALEGPLLAIATGGVLSVVFLDLLPHSLRDARSRGTFAQHALWFVLGCTLMFGVTSLVPHEEHGHDAATTEVASTMLA